jgi:hypothetical protein
LLKLTLDLSLAILSCPTTMLQVEVQGLVNIKPPSLCEWLGQPCEDQRQVSVVLFTLPLEHRSLCLFLH